MVLIDNVDEVVTLTINRPQRKNGLSRAVVDESIAALERIWNRLESRQGVHRHRLDILVQHTSSEPIVPVN